MITVTKTLPTSSWYSGGGLSTITLSGIDNMTFNAKKDLIKIKILQSPNNVNNTGSDGGNTWIKDLKNIEFQSKLRGWLMDTTDSSAWTKAWKLRAMCCTGGPVSSLVIEDKTFGTGSEQAYLEEVNFIAHPNRVQGLTINNTSSASMGVARIEVDLSFYLGTAR